VLAVAAAAVLVVGGGVALAFINGPDSVEAPAASDRLPPVPAEASSGSLVVEQPTLPGDIDAGAVSNDPADWADRALFPTDTPNGYTLLSVSQSSGGNFTESGGVDTGDILVRYISLASTGAADDSLIVIETVPAGIAEIDSDIAPDVVTTDSGAQWDVYVEEQAGSDVYGHAYIRTGGASGMVSVTGLESTDDASVRIESVIASLRLVRVDDIPTDVIDLGRLPVVATVEPGNAAAGFIAASHAANEWCVKVQTPSSESYGCGHRIDTATTPAVLVELGWNDQGDIALAGMTAPGVSSVEIDLADGTTITAEPSLPAGSDGIGFWVASHRLDGTIPQEGPIMATRALTSDGTLLGPVVGP
jgi:hypothetical protein